LKVFSWTFMFTFMGERSKKAEHPLSADAVAPKKPLHLNPSAKANR